ncbi:hypothetical protein KO527_03365 [Pseudoalteromonas sp. C2R02]|uniref:hypothetical protein n=1 Tax=Pseudoalteromonas sp. C2R02 TaxID=2841565 RepID=UPI001C09A360|nr:hypothetical protein [Pseudoalteromonas sp. C2R02]MBU2968394.1 hypothetical protein [Pseudoalteromonas sp. C2R02]
MTEIYLQPLIEITNPDSPPQGVKQLARINDSLNYPKRFYSFYRQGDYLSVVHHWIITPKGKPPYLTTEQFDAPLALLSWFVQKLEFFIKPSFQGGLPANKIATDKERVNGEYIILGRAMDAGNNRREGGYTISNLNRDIYLNKYSSFQDITFSDSFLFQGGLLELFKELATEYDKGTL